MNLKKLIFLLGTLYFSCVVVVTNAQFTDLHWNMGRQTSLDFKTNPPTVDLNDSLYINTLKNTSTSICDRNGNLIFCSNALRVYNKNGHVMPNGTGFNQGTLMNSYASTGSYNPLFKGAVIIPFPNDTNKFYMFYVNMEWHVGINYLPEKLYYLVVDRTLNNGLGDVTIKDQVLINNDTLTFGELMAIKHGNGKDWWVISRKYRSNIFYKFLIDSSGIHSVQKQIIGAAFYDSINTYDYVCNSSLDGEHLAYLKLGDTYNGQLDLVDFDRCSGSLYNYKKMQLITPSAPNFRIRSCCYSPNNKYLYVTDFDTLWQLDLASSNMLTSKVYLGRRHYNRQFFIMKNAPDGKIYMSHYGGWHKISVIEHPDNFGTACNFLEDTIHFGDYFNGPWADGGIPNMPNFNLGKLNCDVGIQATAVNKNEIIIYPNPCKDKLSVNSGQYSVNTIEITDLLGRVCIIPPLQRGLGGFEINIETLPNGVYFLKATDEKGNVMNTKFIKQ